MISFKRLDRSFAHRGHQEEVASRRRSHSSVGGLAGQLETVAAQFRRAQKRHAQRPKVKSERVRSRTICESILRM